MLTGLAQDEVQWAMTHGQVMGAPKNSDGTLPTTCVHIPFTVEPYKYPADAFNKAVALAPVFNKLVDRISRDSQWLLQVLEHTCAHDQFTGQLVDVFKTVLAEGISQQVYLGIHRSDYMIHSIEGDDRNLLQVEINTIASSFGSLSTKLTSMYKVLAAPVAAAGVPTNDSLTEIAGGLVAAHREYLSQYSGTEHANAVIVMVVQPNERNFADQRLLHYEILEKHNIKMVRASLQELHEYGTLSSTADKILLYKGQPVSVVYYRAGYTPDDYPVPACWDARLLVERSSAIKCPSIAYHLTGTKKVQQVIALPGVLEHFLLRDADEPLEAVAQIELLRSVFAGLYSLDPSEQENFLPPSITRSSSSSSTSSSAYQHSFPSLDMLKAAVLANPSKFVLKPQREGGGNNYYDAELVTALSGGKSEEELSSYIMMEKIMPTVQKATLVKNSLAVEAQCLCELGAFGVFLAGSDGVEKVNKYAGYLLRVKPSSSNEGGVAAGFSCLSSPTLF